MTFWIIVSWVFVALLTAVNVFFFIKLKKASDQMMKMAFPGAKNMNDAVSQMQRMMGQMGAGRGGFPSGGPAGLNKNDPRVKAAMDMLQSMQGGRGPKR